MGRLIRSRVLSLSTIFNLLDISCVLGLVFLQLNFEWIFFIMLPTFLLLPFISFVTLFFVTFQICNNYEIVKVSSVNFSINSYSSAFFFQVHPSPKDHIIIPIKKKEKHLLQIKVVYGFK